MEVWWVDLSRTQQKGERERGERGEPLWVVNKEWIYLMDDVEQ